jgi:hypothetical protein
MAGGWLGISGLSPASAPIKDTQHRAQRGWLREAIVWSLSSFRLRLSLARS